jgi:hypothetical protein
MSKTNRFSGILDAARAKQAEEETVEQTQKETETPLVEMAETKIESVEPVIKIAPISETKGREKKGKSSNPSYVQISAYIKKETRTSAGRILIGSDKDLSDIIEELLTNWIKSNT